MESHFRLDPLDKEEGIYSQLELEIAGFRRKGNTMVRYHGGFEDKYVMVHKDLYAFDCRIRIDEVKE